MIGQDALVKTLTNAFASGRIAHAFMLTGVRGIGKTTTARLLARALNYEGPHAGPSVQLDPPGEHCEAINNSAHMDVMEMDAASRTGVGDIREILDSVRYAPVSARYKVYIIDEVHMLSTAAFNALLKTLEEPPDHAKFIFATTEIRKIPITVLSRCQRFDLRRVDGPQLSAHLASISEQEGADIAKDGLDMIARAAEGSVRDGLSLLDQAIVQAEGKKQVSGDDIRAMLGLADRVRVLDLLGAAVGGDAKAALAEVRAQYGDGADPAVIVRDLLDLSHELSRAKALGADAEYDMAPDQIARLVAMADEYSMGELTRHWQLLLKSYDDVRAAPDPLAALEMALLRLSVAGQMPPPEQAAQLLAGLANEPDAPPARQPSVLKEPSAPPQATNPPRTTEAVGSTQAAPKPKAQPLQDTPPSTAVKFENLEAVVNSIPKTNTGLRYDIERYVRPISFEPGHFVFNFGPGAPDDLVRRMSNYLTQSTNRPWEVRLDPSQDGEKPLREKARAAAKAQQEIEANHPVVKKAQALFPGVTVAFEDSLPTSNIIEADFGTQKDLDQ